MDYSFKPTTHGRAVLAACMSLGRPPEICRVAFGSGKIAELANLADQHELLEYVSDGTIANRRHAEDHFYFEVQYANSEHPDIATFMLSEFMVYIIDPETGAETDFLYGTLGDYPLPVPKYHDTIAPCTFNLPLVVVISDDLEVHVAAPPGLVTYDDLMDAVNTVFGLKGVPGGLAGLDENGRVPADQLPVTTRIVATRIRDPSKPDYGISGAVSAALKLSKYTGKTEVGAVVNGVLYDANNMSADGGTAPDGTIIIKAEE